MCAGTTYSVLAPLGRLIKIILQFVLAPFTSLHAGKKQGVSRIPGPWPPLPIVGTTWRNQLHGAPSTSDFLACTEARYQEFGPLVREVALLGFTMVHVYDPKDVSTVLRVPSKYPLRPPMQALVSYRQSRPDRYCTPGLVNAQGPEWHHLRTRLAPALMSGAGTGRFLQTLRPVAKDLAILLQSCKRLDMQVMANRFGLEAVCMLALGRRMGFLQAVDQLPEDAQKLLDAQEMHWQALHDELYGLPWWKVFPSKAFRDFARSEDAMYTLVEDMMTQAQMDGLLDPDCVLTSILKAEDVDPREKKAAIIDFVLSGIEPVGNSLVFLLYQLAKNPSAQKKLRDEVFQEIGQDEEVTWQALGRMSYLRACLQEAFRIMPTAPCLARILEEDLTLQGHNVPSGTFVLCHTWHACLQEESFDRAKEYLPERWLQDPANGSCKSAPANFLVVPFGCGRRTCPGRKIAHLELQLAAIEVLRLSEVCYEDEMQLEFRFVQFPKSPLNFYLRPIQPE